MKAGPTGYGLYDGIVVQGYPCLVAAPSMIPKAPKQKVKTNRLDSRSLSENLRGGQLKSIGKVGIDPGKSKITIFQVGD